MTRDQLIDKLLEKSGAYTWLHRNGYVDKCDGVIDRHIANQDSPLLPAWPMYQGDEWIVKSAADVLDGLVADSFVAALNRSEVVALLGTLGRLDAEGVTICKGVTISHYELAYRWNKHHPAEEKVYPVTPERRLYI